MQWSRSSYSAFICKNYNLGQRHRQLAEIIGVAHVACLTPCALSPRTALRSNHNVVRQLRAAFHAHAGHHEKARAPHNSDKTSRPLHAKGQGPVLRPPDTFGASLELRRTFLEIVEHSRCFHMWRQRSPAAGRPPGPPPAGLAVTPAGELNDFSDADAFNHFCLPSAVVFDNFYRRDLYDNTYHQTFGCQQLQIMKKDEKAVLTSCIESALHECYHIRFFQKEPNCSFAAYNLACFFEERICDAQNELLHSI